jgi:hypothetical protein
MMGRLRLTSQESEAFVLKDGGDEDLGCPEWALAGKVLAPNVLHISTIKAALRAAWGNPKGLEVRSMGPNQFMAEFATIADKSRVQEGSPWHVGRHAVLLNEFDPSLRPTEYCFEELDVWVRILNLPYGLMNNQWGKELAGRIGKVGKMDVDDKGRAWGDYLRFRAAIKIKEPLMRCVSVFSQKRQATEHYTVMYECLATFCFSCGLLGHASTLCLNPAERDDEGFLPYHGPRLCVPDDRKKKAPGVNSGQSSFSSDQGSWQGSGRNGPNMQTNKNQKDKEGIGEATSPVKPKKSRQRKPSTGDVNARKTAAGMKGEAPRGLGRKVYKRKAPAAAPPCTDLVVAVPSGGSDGALPLVPTTHLATEDGGEELVADSNKKHKPDAPASPRSADLAATAEQSRPTQ